MKDSLIDSLGYVLVKYVAALVRRLPLRLALHIAVLCGTIVYIFHRRRRVAYVNLKAAFGARYTPKELRLIVRRIYQHMAQTGVELFRAPFLDERYVEENITIHGFERISQELKKGKGLVFLTAHFGNWELLAIVSALKKLPMKVLAREQKHSRLNDVLNSFRSTHGNEVIGKGMAIREIVQALRKNNIVGILSDQSGGSDGVYVRFFGRETTTPPGVVAIAQRTGCSVLPAFMVREANGKHQIYIEEPLHIPHTGSEGDDIKKGLENYLGVLERFTTEYPDQWLWGHKRWKYTLNKRILVLSDGKPGHQTQSQAVCSFYETIGKEKGLHIESSIVKVIYRSSFHRLLLFVLSPVLKPWIQGRIDVVQHFLTAESYQSIVSQYADIVVSCGASTAPLHILVAHENDAKRVVIMKPPFPYTLFRSEIVIVPYHDTVFGAKKNMIRMKTALTPLNKDMLVTEGEKLWRTYHLPTRGIISIFIGGDTKNYRYSTEYVTQFCHACVRIATEKNGVLLVTTSRRTRPEVIAIIKQIMGAHERCKLCVVPTEQNIPDVVYGMLGATDVSIVTEDSVSMISESVQAGKPVYVVSMAEKGLPRKHARFQHALKEEGLITCVTPYTVYDVYMHGKATQGAATIYEKEREQLLNALRATL